MPSFNPYRGQTFVRISRPVAAERCRWRGQTCAALGLRQGWGGAYTHEAKAARSRAPAPLEPIAAFGQRDVRARPGLGCGCGCPAHVSAGEYHGDRQRGRQATVAVASRRAKGERRRFGPTLPRTTPQAEGVEAGSGEEVAEVEPSAVPGSACGAGGGGCRERVYPRSPRGARRSTRVGGRPGALRSGPGHLRARPPQRADPLRRGAPAAAPQAPQRGMRRTGSCATTSTCSARTVSAT
jgi:hypothetical protein